MPCIVIRLRTDLSTTFQFPSDVPFGEEAKEAYAPLTDDIAAEPDLIWNVLTEDPERKVAGGIYLFKDQASVQTYTEKHSKRLRDFVVTGEITAVGYEVNEGLSEVSHAALTR